ncbi:hypothetical protein PR048_022296 [Dryococelus australis]|uniref:Uncharacterized protein n=1 Tax=Dryococelus australis TaxID=614101 RepID=A0ABQ9H0R9_9NEOP|nr:hypothetical protein PR048_022296 [Dryococelus australis]
MGVTKKAEKYVLAVVTQHNFILSSKQAENIKYCPQNFVDREDNGILVPGEWHNDVGRLPHVNLGRLKSNNTAKVSVIVHNTVADFLVDEGYALWQYETINRGWAM